MLTGSTSHSSQPVGLKLLSQSPPGNRSRQFPWTRFYYPVTWAAATFDTTDGSILLTTSFFLLLGFYLLSLCWIFLFSFWFFFFSSQLKCWICMYLFSSFFLSLPSPWTILCFCHQLPKLFVLPWKKAYSHFWSQNILAHFSFWLTGCGRLRSRKYAILFFFLIWNS